MPLLKRESVVQVKPVEPPDVYVKTEAQAKYSKPAQVSTPSTYDRKPPDTVEGVIAEYESIIKNREAKGLDVYAEYHIILKALKLLKGVEDGEDKKELLGNESRRTRRG